MVSSALPRGVSSPRTPSREVTADEAIRSSARCRECNKPHDFIRASATQGSWASPDDGHSYQPYVQPETLALMHYLVTGEREWRYPCVPAKWWTDKVVHGR